MTWYKQVVGFHHGSTQPHMHACTYAVMGAVVWAATGVSNGHAATRAWNHRNASRFPPAKPSLALPLAAALPPWLKMSWVLPISLGALLIGAEIFRERG